MQRDLHRKIRQSGSSDLLRLSGCPEEVTGIARNETDKLRNLVRVLMRKRARICQGFKDKLIELGQRAFLDQLRDQIIRESPCVADKRITRSEVRRRLQRGKGIPNPAHEAQH